MGNLPFSPLSYCQYYSLVLTNARAVAGGVEPQTKRWPMAQLEAKLISIADAARSLGIGKTKTYELISEQLLETVSIGSRRLVKVSSINKLIDSSNMGGAA